MAARVTAGKGQRRMRHAPQGAVIGYQKSCGRKVTKLSGWKGGRASGSKKWEVDSQPQRNALPGRNWRDERKRPESTPVARNMTRCSGMIRNSATCSTCVSATRVRVLVAESQMRSEWNWPRNQPKKSEMR